MKNFGIHAHGLNGNITIDQLEHSTSTDVNGIQVFFTGFENEAERIAFIAQFPKSAALKTISHRGSCALGQIVDGCNQYGYPVVSTRDHGPGGRYPEYRISWETLEVCFRMTNLNNSTGTVNESGAKRFRSICKVLRRLFPEGV